jgi:hypothetical protein
VGIRRRLPVGSTEAIGQADVEAGEGMHLLD